MKYWNTVIKPSKLELIRFSMEIGQNTIFIPFISSSSTAFKSVPCLLQSQVSQYFKKKKKGNASLAANYPFHYIVNFIKMSPKISPIFRTMIFYTLIPKLRNL